MSRLIDADSIPWHLQGVGYIPVITQEEIDEMKSVDAVPVVRCKDCIYQVESWSGIKYCEAHGDHIGKDYDYCSNARRK